MRWNHSQSEDKFKSFIIVNNHRKWYQKGRENLTAHETLLTLKLNIVVKQASTMCQHHSEIRPPTKKLFARGKSENLSLSSSNISSTTGNQRNFNSSFISNHLESKNRYCINFRPDFSAITRTFAWCKLWVFSSENPWAGWHFLHNFFHLTSSCLTHPFAPSPLSVPRNKWAHGAATYFILYFLSFFNRIKFRSTPYFEGSFRASCSFRFSSWRRTYVNVTNF